MVKRFVSEILPILVILALAPWVVTYTQGAGGDVPADEPVRIRVAEASAMPSWRTFGKAVGGVDTPGDLFSFDATERTDDITVNLCIVNTRQLSSCYTYLTLQVGVYVQGGAGGWEKASRRNNEPVPEIYLTLRSGQASFTLPGGAEYKVTIDDGSFYCSGTGSYGGCLSPRFSLTVD